MGRILFHADFISQFRQHGQVFPDGDAGGGEHVSGDGGIRSGHEDFPAVVLHGVPSGGDADEAVRHDEPHQGHDAQLLLQKTAWLKRYFLYGETLREDMCKLQYIIF